MRAWKRRRHRATTFIHKKEKMPARFPAQDLKAMPPAARTSQFVLPKTRGLWAQKGVFAVRGSVKLSRK